MKPAEHVKVLICEDSPSIAALYQSVLEDHDYDVTVCPTVADTLASLERTLPEVLLLDMELEDAPGITVLEAIQKAELPVTTVVVTAHGSVDLAVQTMNLGSFDFVEKPVSPGRLLVTVQNAVEHQRLMHRVQELEDTWERDSFQGFIGASSAMQAVYSTVRAAADSRASIFITGESGTGKEVCAAAIHNHSSRRKEEFVALNCAAIPRELMESEVFGHVKGAFTGAHSAREGAASRADGGTLFLDELCEMDLDLQSKLLRFIQTGTFQKVGGSKQEQVDVRFVCATNRDPWGEVQAGRFREDLYFRLHVVPVEMPSLRERGSDILLLAEHFLGSMSEEEGREFRGFSPDCAELMMAYNWPGNVRQLQNVIRNIVVLNRGTEVTSAMLPREVLSGADASSAAATATPAAIESPVAAAGATPPTALAAAPDVATTEDSGEIIPLWQEEKRVIERAIALCDGNIPRAAAALDISPSTIYRKKQAWDE